MTPAHPHHLAEALRARRWLVSAWPWRALAYLITTVPIAGVLSVGLFVIGAPLLAAVNGVRQQGRPVELPLVLFLAVGSLIMLALAPIASFAVAAVERWRLGLVDTRPLPAQPWPGLVARYTSAAAWREVAYAFWLGGVVPIAYWAFLLLVLLDLTLIASPWLAGDADEVIVVWTTVDTAGQAIPYAIVGVLLIPVLWYRSGCSSPPRPRWPGGCSAGRPTRRRCARWPGPGPGWSTRTRRNAAASSATCTTARSPG